VEEFAEQVIKLSPSEVLAFCGQNDQRIRDLEAHVKARIVLRGNDIRILGAPAHVDEAYSLISDLLETQRRSGSAVTREQFRSALRTFRRRENGEASDAPRGNGSPGEERVEKFSELFLDSIPVPLKRRRLSPLTPGQKRYVEAIRTCDIVCIVGGRSGTLGEFSIAYDEGKLIAVLQGTGGIAEHIGEIVAMIEKHTDAEVIYSHDPQELIEAAIQRHFERVRRGVAYQLRVVDG